VKRAAVVFVAWGMWLGAWTAVQLLFVDATFPERTIQWVMLGAAALGAFTTGIVIRRLASRRGGEAATQLITSESTASATVAVGLAVLLVGASFGLFLVLIGGGTTLFGLAGVIREQRVRRRLARRRMP